MSSLTARCALVLGASLLAASGCGVKKVKLLSNDGGDGDGGRASGDAAPGSGPGRDAAGVGPADAATVAEDAPGGGPADVPRPSADVAAAPDAPVDFPIVIPPDAAVAGDTQAPPPPDALAPDDAPADAAAPPPDMDVDMAAPSPDAATDTAPPPPDMDLDAPAPTPDMDVDADIDMAPDMDIDAAATPDMDIDAPDDAAPDAPPPQLDVAPDSDDAADDSAADAPVDAASDMTVDMAALCPSPSRACYSGTQATRNVGACREGIQYCTNGVWGPCIGEVLPAAAESCNNIDDDCDGTPAMGAAETGLGMISCGVGTCAAKENACTNGQPGMCVPGTPAGSETCNDGDDDDCNGIIDDPSVCGCIYVDGTTGNDNNAGLMPNEPKATIDGPMGGIAAAVASSTIKRLCVAAGAGCSSTPATVDYTEAVNMKNGISVYGGYDSQGATWKRNVGNCVTRIVAPNTGQNNRAVLFDVTVTSATMLDGFVVQANNATTNQAILVQGSTGAVISNNVVSGGGGSTSYGINVIADATSSTKATPLITNNAITGGTGSAFAAGVRASQSAPRIQGNCASASGAALDGFGRCQVWGCFQATRYIRGRSSGNAGAPGAETYAVRLEDAADTLIEQSALCSSSAEGVVAGVRLSGDGANVLIRTSRIVAPGGGNNNRAAIAVWADPCNGASPWVLDNYELAGNSGTLNARAEGVRAVGDCHVRVDKNRLIVGGDESSYNDAAGVWCARDTTSGIASRCTILDNADIRGSSAGFPPLSVGVRCDRGACLRIERNNITGHQGDNTVGVMLNNASTFVNRNTIRAGCARRSGTGVLAIDAPARVQNNVIFGATCLTGNSSGPGVGEAVRVQIGSGSDEIDLHSNTLVALGAPLATCSSQALVFDNVPTVTPAGPRGVIRNNIFHAGLCTGFSADVVERETNTDPRVFENNDFWYSSASVVLYRDENSTNLSSMSAVNASVDPTGMSNISVDPLWVGGPNYHLTSSSGCRNAGTAAGAPTDDLDGQTRPNESLHDIGADEYYP